MWAWAPPQRWRRQHEDGHHDARRGRCNGASPRVGGRRQWRRSPRRPRPQPQPPQPQRLAWLGAGATAVVAKIRCCCMGGDGGAQIRGLESCECGCWRGGGQRVERRDDARTAPEGRHTARNRVTAPDRARRAVAPAAATAVVGRGGAGEHGEAGPPTAVLQTQPSVARLRARRRRCGRRSCPRSRAPAHRAGRHLAANSLPHPAQSRASRRMRAAAIAAAKAAATTGSAGAAGGRGAVHTLVLMRHGCVRCHRCCCGR